MKRTVVAFMTLIVMGCLIPATALAGGPGPDCIGYDRPVTGTDSYVLEEGSSLSIPASGILANDQSQQNPTQQLVAGGVNYTTPFYAYDQWQWVNPDPDGAFVFTPPTDFYGEISYNILVFDQGNPDCPTPGLLTFNVTPTQDAPVATDDALSVNEDEPATANVVVNDVDKDGDALQVTDVTGSQNGVCTLQSGQVRYAPNPDFNGADDCVVTISDGNGNTDVSTLNVIVNPVNDAPVAQGTVTGGQLTATGNCSGSSDIDGDSLTCYWNFGDSTGSWSGVNVSHQYATPGTYTVTLSVRDSAGAYSSLTQTVSVSPNTLQVASANVSTPEGGKNASHTVNVVVSLAQASLLPVTFNYATTNGSASTGSDYYAASGSKTIAAGQTSVSIPVTVIGDNRREQSETFSLSVSQPNNAVVLGSATTTVTIVNDD